VPCGLLQSPQTTRAVSAEAALWVDSRMPRDSQLRLRARVQAESGHPYLPRPRARAGPSPFSTADLVCSRTGSQRRKCHQGGPKICERRPQGNRSRRAPRVKATSSSSLWPLRALPAVGKGSGWCRRPACSNPAVQSAGRMETAEYNSIGPVQSAAPAGPEKAPWSQNRHEALAGCKYMRSPVTPAAMQFADLGRSYQSLRCYQARG
jgi:hypothetical protein